MLDGEQPALRVVTVILAVSCVLQRLKYTVCCPGQFALVETSIYDSIIQYSTTKVCIQPRPQG